jgi:hypothetical protein
VFPKDRYEFTIGEPKTFFGQNAKGADSYGVRYPLTIADGPYKGKRTIISLWQQSEGAQSMAKQFLMAALGYGKGRAEEVRFDEEWGAKDWSFDTDSGTVGDAWRELTGNRIVGDLDNRMDDNQVERQDFKGWSAFGR